MLLILIKLKVLQSSTYNVSPNFKYDSKVLVKNDPVTSMNEPPPTSPFFFPCVCSYYSINHPVNLISPLQEIEQLSSCVATWMYLLIIL